MMAWHYTCGDRALSIMDDGWIRVAHESASVGERPCVWFSVAQRWEPTATKLIHTPSGPRQGTLQEMEALGGGLWRFGLPAADLLQWRELRTQIGLPRPLWKQLAKLGEKKGANPEDWYGSLEPVDVTRCVVQFLRGGCDAGEWETCDELMVQLRERAAP